MGAGHYQGAEILPGSNDTPIRIAAFARTLSMRVISWLENMTIESY